MATLWEKALTFLGLVEEVQEEETEENVERNLQPVSRGNVINLHNAINTSSNMRLVITKPQEFAEAQAIVGHIKNKKSVLVNLEDTEISVAKRIIDFISGATYALDGNMQKVSQQIFVFTPAQVEINDEMRKELNERGIITDFDK
ncbi:MAG: cell division protein SepF [Firmicutes bacterium]|nr:cell division protein SepF [Bacillota bacterium]